MPDGCTSVFLVYVVRGRERVEVDMITAISEYPVHWYGLHVEVHTDPEPCIVESRFRLSKYYGNVYSNNNKLGLHIHLSLSRFGLGHPV